MQVETRIRFHQAKIVYFGISRLYAYVKQIICEGVHFWLKFKYKITIYKKFGNSNENTFSFIHVCYFSYHIWIAASEDQILTTLFSTKIMGEETQPQEHQHPCSILLTFCHSAPCLSKNHTKPNVDKKIQACKTHWLRTLYFPCTNAQYLVYYWRHWFQIYCGNNKTFFISL